MKVSELLKLVSPRQAINVTPEKNADDIDYFTGFAGDMQLDTLGRAVMDCEVKSLQASSDLYYIDGDYYDGGCLVVEVERLRIEVER